MKLLLGLLLLSALSAFIYDEKPRPRRAQLVKLNSSKRNSKRKLFLDDLKNNYGSYDTSLMSTTNNHIDMMQSQNRQNTQMRQLGSWFGDLDMTVDEYRDSISKKLEQLNMNLQRPKIPVPAFGAGLIPPFAASLPSFAGAAPYYGTTVNAFSSNQPYSRGPTTTANMHSNRSMP